MAKTNVKHTVYELDRFTGWTLQNVLFDEDPDLVRTHASSESDVSIRELAEMSAEIVNKALSTIALQDIAPEDIEKTIQSQCVQIENNRKHYAQKKEDIRIRTIYFSSDSDDSAYWGQ